MFSVGETPKSKASRRRRAETTATQDQDQYFCNSHLHPLVSSGRAERWLAEVKNMRTISPRSRSTLEHVQGKEKALD